MDIEQRTKESLIRDLERQLTELQWDIDKRGLEIVRITEAQKVAKRKRKLLTEAIAFIKEN